MADIRAQLDRVRDAANDMADTASTRLKESSDKALESVQAGRDLAGEAYADARDKTQRAATRVNQVVQEHPVAAVAGAVIAGAVIAWAFPRSRAAMKALPAFAVTAGSRIAEAAIAARAAAAEGAVALKDNAGTAFDTVRDGASDAVSTARDTALSADISGKLSRLTDEIVTLVAGRAETIGEAVKARLPKR